MKKQDFILTETDSSYLKKLLIRLGGGEDVVKLMGPDELTEALKSILENKKKEVCIPCIRSVDKPVEASQEEMLFYEQLNLHIEKVLSGLTVDEYGVIVLTFGIGVDNLPIKEIAELYHMTPQEVITTKRNAIEHIRKSKVFRHLKREYKDSPKVCSI